MASYPIPGLYRIWYIPFFIQELVWPRTPYLVYIGFSMKYVYIGISIASYSQLVLYRIWSALDTIQSCRHM